jgi:hypothetical protein
MCRIPAELIFNALTRRALTRYPFCDHDSVRDVQRYVAQVRNEARGSGLRESHPASDENVTWMTRLKSCAPESMLVPATPTRRTHRSCTIALRATSERLRSAA